MERLRSDFLSLLAETDTTFHRYMYDRINWNNRMVGLTGPRGVGKTTLFLQYIKEHLPVGEALYVTADDLWFSGHTLLDLARDFYQKGGHYLFIDEVHKYAEWSRELKLIYDKLPTLSVAFTGSSVLDISRGAHDLSRRAVMYHMQGLSFREYLELYHQIRLPVHTLDEIIGGALVPVKGFRPLAYFSQYLAGGYYPFGIEDDTSLRIKQVINLSLESDLPQFAGISVTTGRKLKRLLSIIAESVPFKPNMSSIAQMLGVSRSSLTDYFLYLEEAGFISQLRNDTGGIRGLGKVEKVYLDNPNLAYVLATESPDVGNVRETFFMNQLRVDYDPIASTQADFTIGKRTFEIGGPGKGMRQLEGAGEGYVVKDGIEYGSDRTLPLWQMGLTY